MKTTLLSIALTFVIVTTASSTTIRFSEVCPKDTPDSISMPLKHKDQTEVLFVKNAVIASDKDIQSAFYFKDDQGGGISMTLFPESAKRFDDAIKDLRGHRLAIIVDDNLISAPTLQTTHLNGRVQITGNFSEEEAKKIASNLSQKKTEQGAAANP
jgi:preprotein translocase subunit SecD